MTNPLNLLSFQTFTESTFTEERNPDGVTVKDIWYDTERPILAPQRKSQPQVLVQTTKPIFNSEISASSSRVLAKACGNCALAYGLPNLNCALTKENVNALETCGSYLSPFEITKAR